MSNLTWQQFEHVDIRVGTIVEAIDFPEARNPAYLLIVDFGADIGTKKSSAQITEHYSKQDLVGRQVLGVVNFPPKQIGPIMSECLVTGFYDENGAVVLASVDSGIANGAKLG
ncbi:tRNA-binding protein [Aliiglaciecola sp.]|nr:tRNA-binding protein [Aliiglaciecola sp.]